jgi:predicted short-subunit dehydrogenase-like oxidoreductase (DUF2520 family)
MTRRRQVVLVGSGRMGSAFARSMRAAKVSFALVRARSAKWTLPARRGASRTVILAVTDAAIAQTADRLVQSDCLARGDSIVHLAGMRGPAELDAAAAIGAHVGAMHPLVAVASRTSPPLLRGMAATFEGDRAALAAVRAVAARIGLTVHALERVDRARYHAAAALCATGGVALAQAAAVLFARSAAGVSDEDASAYAASLLASVAHNVAHEGAQGALASPLLRGDTTAVERHLDAMAVHDPAAQLYRAALAQVIASLDATGAVDRAVLDRAREILAARTSR